MYICKLYQVYNPVCAKTMVQFPNILNKWVSEYETYVYSYLNKLLFIYN